MTRKKQFTEAAVREIRRKTRRKFAPEEKVGIVLEGLRGEQSTIARQKLAAYPPDFLIEIARNQCGTMEFDRADELIELGFQKTRQLLGRL
jgi:predicted acylesterase/phospholipase RssA